MKRVLLALLLLGLLFVGARALVWLLASDETRIRWRIEAMVEGFNATRMNPILDGLAREFVEETWGADRELARAGLARLFLERKDPVSRGFLYVLEVPDEELAIELQPGEPARAKVGMVLQVEERRGAERTLAWKARLEGELVESDDGWKFTRARCDTLEGARLR